MSSTHKGILLLNERRAEASGVTGSLLDRYLPVKRSAPVGGPKNGKFLVFLLAGGTRSTAREIREKLARIRGVYVKYHLDIDKDHQWDRPIPEDVDLVLVLKDAIQHKQTDRLIPLCKQVGVRFVRTQRKWATMMMALHNHGIHKGEPLDEGFISMMQFSDDPVPLRLAGPAEELKLLDPAPVLNLVVQQATLPVAVPEPKKRIPSPRLAAVAAVLNAMCAEEEVSVLCDGKQMTFNSA